MNRGLRMDDHLNAVEANIEKPARFDNLKSLVHQRGRIDRDALTHLPVWMRQGLLRGCFRNFCRRGCAKWTSGSRQDQALDFASVAGAQALMDRVVLAIHW